MALILGIGIGLFVLILLCYVGPGFIALTALITGILFAIPRRKPFPVSSITSGAVGEKSPMASEYDWSAYFVLPMYLVLSLVTFSLSSVLLVNFYLFQERSK
ncbi:hypothetical protein TYRP_010887 [Tyrophagus putrescentiae]|nr:hypothetical protein TYRP_010887 [Tyrophagus putrescentiae]